MRSIIHTIEEKCQGCNKCIVKCPVNANTATIVDGQNIIHINEERCIHCGECIKVCDHGARYFVDDIDAFFSALANGERITVLAAPAIRANFPNYKRLFGFLKSKKVNLIYDVSFGADITTWAYLKYLKENPNAKIISQPCPVIVAGIETYFPELIPHLAPIHSPAMCAAVYLKNYKHNTDKIAFLSPCIAKSVEFQDANTNGLIKYNVTYKKIQEYLEKNNIYLNNYNEADYDSKPCDLGFTYSRPGGLRENVEFFAGDNVWIKQVEGVNDIHGYLQQYNNRIRNRKNLPDLVDVLNCRNGCNLGTATLEGIEEDGIDEITNHTKKEFLKKHAEKEKAADLLAKTFDKELKLEDFARAYKDNSMKIKQANEASIQEVFDKLGKSNKEYQSHNCYACGYGNCREFAKAVSLGDNHIENCFYYSRTKLDKGKTEFDTLFDKLFVELKKMDSGLEKLEDSSDGLNNIALQTQLISINASIEAVHAGQHGLGFTVVADEIKKLSDQSATIINRNLDNEADLKKAIDSVRALINDIVEKMHIALSN